MTDICMLYQGQEAHPAHQSFAESVHADYRHFETGNPLNSGASNTNKIVDRIKTAVTLDDYSIIIAEGTAPLQTALIYKILHHTSTIIYLAADETFYSLPQRPTRHFWKGLRPMISRLLDGVIAVGRDVYNWAEPFIGPVPVEYVHPPIADEKYERLGAIDSKSPQDDFLVLSVGMARPSNGYETLVSAIERLAEEHDNIKLVLLGSGHKLKSYSESSVVITPGFVGIDEFVKWFQQASIYMQPSIGDSFPVATLEGILSGTPTIVTQAVGVRELLPEEQVVDPTITGLYQGAKHFYQMDLNKRYEIGNEQRDLVSDFTEANQKRRFRESINNLT